ncbi:MAG: (2Fe-2S)-binding protein [Candidatus Cloacimonetes bacterium]|nr:(2Fe-2S)-binding protein [Candidatus Cloacimonadota bacterium]MBS3767437.1 (2Fe-2S)-binding protein [Candidatus Cloacimonadota bacterium]
MNITFNLNNKETTVKVDPRQTLLQTLREDLQMLGTKKGCGKGECGACTVFLDNKIVNSCLIPIKQVENRKVITIEGVKRTKYFSKIQKAYEDSGAVQCGFCIPGFVMATVDFLKNITDKCDISDEEIKIALSGNLCRCTGYIKIINAVHTLLAQDLEIPEEII